ncbi:S1/P1 nuclease [Tundrisphaera sp. TA3]|uniref:S1/P1 nuclease n=1 Tax=Tundrisphaera sp. TA3 TaxID=3435775 RepID=UPI003EB822F6
MNPKVIGRTPRAIRILGVSLLALALMPGLAQAWGVVGHRVAGRIAEARLTPAARSALRALLEPGESLADVSTWADENRADHPEAATWHYINIPITEPRYDRKFILKQGSVVDRIEHFRSVLEDPRASRSQRIMALRYLVHFIQDVHQPLHVGHRNDKGGNDLQVQWFGRNDNLHRIWDSGLLGEARMSERNRVSKLTATITPELAEAWSKGGVDEWANESLDIAREAYKHPGTGAAIRRGDRLGEDYQAANLPLAERRVTQAGVRLAQVLNEILKP